LPPMQGASGRTLWISNTQLQSNGQGLLSIVQS
jgi:hypothetical protein